MKILGNMYIKMYANISKRLQIYYTHFPYYPFYSTIYFFVINFLHIVTLISHDVTY